MDKRLKRKRLKLKPCRLHSGRCEGLSEGIYNFLIGICLRLSCFNLNKGHAEDRKMSVKKELTTEHSNPYKKPKRPKK